ncbi:MAG: transcription antitermination factor NusB [Micromonosporaceae bacterium]|nr:transcription antitermination factor NusB [Micromonosporaceae bacterium]
MNEPVRSGKPVSGRPAEKPVDFNPSRRKSRRRALDALYSADLRRASAPAVLADTVARMGRDVPPHMAYATEIVAGVAAHAERIDELLSTYAEGWTLDRMPVVDRNIARIGVYEMLFRDDVDDAVAISEAVALAEEFSTGESPRFLNGLLGRIGAHALARDPGSDDIGEHARSRDEGEGR